MPFPQYHNNPLPPNKTSPLYVTKNISGGFVHSDFLVVAKCSFAPSMAIGAGNDTNLPKKELVLF
jgi:hypothetical protein